MLDLIAPTTGIAVSAVVAAAMRDRSAIISASSGFAAGIAAGFVVWFLMMAWVLRP